MSTLSKVKQREGSYKVKETLFKAGLSTAKGLKRALYTVVKSLYYC